MSYVSLHNHSHYSLMDGYMTIPEMISRSKELGYKAIALSDHGSMAGITDFYDHCVEADIKPLVACEFYFTPDHTIKDRKFTYHLLLIAKNDIGYYNMKKLDSLSYTEEYFYYKPRIDYDALRKYSDGIICCTACMASIIHSESAEEWVQKYYDVFHDDMYLEIQPNDMDEQRAYNEKVIEYSRKYHIGLIVSTDAHYASPDDEPYHHLWTTIRGGDGYHDNENYLWSEEELRSTSLLPNGVIDECIANTQEIADKCHVVIKVEGNHYPQYPTDNPAETIRQICRSNWKSKVPRDEYAEHAKHFNEEMPVLKQMNYLNYFLIVWDAINYCNEHGIMTGPGRGSVGGCDVAYLMDIHKVNVVEHGTMFFRFVNPYRTSPCDIDTDVQTSRRGELIEYLRKKYGHVTKIFTANLLGDPDKGGVGKSAVQRAAQVLHIEPSVVDEITKQMTDSIDDIATIKSSLSNDERDRLIDVSKHFYGRLEKRGIHASAILITPDEPENYTPLEGCYSNDTSTGKREWIQAATYPYHWLEEECGLLKLDILGIATLSVIQDTFADIEKSTGNKLSFSSIPLDDAGVYKDYADGNMSGVFQMESGGMRKMAKDLGVSEFADIAGLISIFRPGPLDSGLAAQYVEGKNGKVIDYPCEAMKEITGNTYGVLVYQEQVIKIAMKMAGYNLGQADGLRKIIGRKELTKIDAAVKDFVDSAMGQGYSKDVAESVGFQIKTAGRYLFNYSHAVEYSLVSYVTAWLKHHYPAFYLKSLMNSKAKQEDVLPYIEECHRLSIEVLPPDYSVGNRDWTVEGNAIRCGLCYIKGVGKNLTVKPTKSWSALVAMNNKRVTENLIKAGALDYIGKSRGWMLSNLEDAQATLKRKAQCEDRIAINEQALANATTDKERSKYIRQRDQWKAKLSEAEFTETAESSYDATAGEIEVLSFSFNALPKVLTGTAKRVTEFNDKNGHAMARIAFSTKYGEFEGVVFASAWKKQRYRDRYRGWCEGITVEQGKSYEFMMKKGVFVDVREIHES